MRWVVLVLAVLLVSCAQERPADPNVAIADLKTACAASCTTTTSATVTIPASWSLTADADGFCLKKDSRILCATCDCHTYGFTDATLLPASDAERTVTCSFTGDADLQTLTATCA